MGDDEANAFSKHLTGKGSAMQENQEPTTDPNCWYYTFYYAPKDPRVIVPKRRGWGTTLNFARPQSYLLLMTPFLIGAIILTCVVLTR